MKRPNIRFACIQMAMTKDKEANVTKAEKIIDRAVRNHRPDIIGLPELFNTWYFPLKMKPVFYQLAESVEGESISRIRQKAREHSVVIIAPFFRDQGRLLL